MHKQYEAFDPELLKNDFLKRHYECLPFIGEKYEESRLLLIGESHYVKSDEVDCVNRRDFYDVPFDDLKEGEYKGWIHTRNVFERRVYNHEDFKAFFYNPATEIAKAIHHTDELSKEQKIEAMHSYAFMNYFKRPAYNAGKTIKGLTDTDKKYAYEISCSIIDVLNPNLIVFMSKKAYNSFFEFDKDSKVGSKYIIKCVSHPCSAWWNRKRKDGKNGKEEFYEYVTEIL